MIHLPPVMMEAWVQPQISQSVGFLVDRVSLGQVFLQVLKFLLPLSLHQHSILRFHMCAVDTIQSLQLAASFGNT